MEFGKIFETIQIPVMALIVWTLCNAVFGPVFIEYFPGLTSHLYIIATSIGTEMDEKYLSSVVSLAVNAVVAIYCGYSLTKNSNSYLDSAGVCGTLVVVIPFIIGVLIIDIERLLFLYEIGVEMTTEVESFVVIFLLIQSLILMGEIILGFISGLVGWFIAKKMKI